jgi:hypothetical protein
MIDLTLPDSGPKAKEQHEGTKGTEFHKVRDPSFFPAKDMSTKRECGRHFFVKHCVLRALRVFLLAEFNSNVR